jgi:hypothetical protein
MSAPNVKLIVNQNDFGLARNLHRLFWSRHLQKQIQPGCVSRMEQDSALRVLHLRKRGCDQVFPRRNRQEKEIAFRAGSHLLTPVRRTGLDRDNGGLHTALLGIDNRSLDAPEEASVGRYNREHNESFDQGNLLHDHLSWDAIEGKRVSRHYDRLTNPHNPHKQNCSAPSFRCTLV